jgi:hypothetical protein
MDTAHLDKYGKEFEKHMNEVDGLALIVLKGHLIIEGILDNVIALIFFHLNCSESTKQTADRHGTGIRFMPASGHPMDMAPVPSACPLRPQSGQTGSRLAKST